MKSLKTQASLVLILLGLVTTETVGQNNFDLTVNGLTVDVVQTQPEIPGYAYHWHYGDGSVQEGYAVPPYNYQTTGLYTLCLLTFDLQGQPFGPPDCIDILAGQGCEPLNNPEHFEFLLDTEGECGFPGIGGCLNPLIGVDLSDYCVLWDWGDGSSEEVSLNLCPYHFYSCEGIYQVTATVYCCGDPVSTGLSYTQTVTITCECNTSVGFEVNDQVDSCTVTSTVFQPFGLCEDDYCYNWWWGDGSFQSGGASASHTYATPGTYNRCVEISCCLTPGSSSWYCDQVVVQDCPCEPITGVSIETIDVSTICKQWGFGLDYPADVDETQYCVTWDFGDGETWSDANLGTRPPHTYDCNGTYDVCATIECCNDPGAVTQVCTTITVNCPCEPPSGPFAFVGGVSGCTYTAAVFGTCSEHCLSWDFGDGSAPVSGNDVSHTYQSNGTYTRCLTIYCCNNPSESITLCAEVNITDCPCSVPPATSFTALATINEENCSVGLCLWGAGGYGDLAPIDVYDPDYCYIYDFGDGYVVESEFQICPQHIYECDGDYTACITVYCCADPTQSVTVCQNITLDCPCEAPGGPFIMGITGLDCTKNFSFGFFNGCLDEYSYTWDFGDGSSPVIGGTDISHTFPASGTYEVCVLVACLDDPSVSITKCWDVTVTCPCTQEDLWFWTLMGIEETAECGIFQALLEYPDGVDESKYCMEWDWGDGTVTSSGIADLPIHEYECNGSYPVVAKLFCCDSEEEAFFRSFTAEVNCPCEPPSTPFELAVGAIDCSVSGEVTGGDCPDDYCYEWSFFSGDIPVTGGETASYTYPASGTYTVCVRIYCCDDLSSPITVLCDNITVECPCQALDSGLVGVSFDYIDGCNLIGFHANIGIPGMDGSQYCADWDYGDGFQDVNVGLHPVHNYPCDGIFSACVTVYCCDDPAQSVVVCLPVEVQCPCNIAPFSVSGIATPTVTVGENCGVGFSFPTPCSEPDLCWEWDFGDGTTVTGGNDVNHIYPASGVYTWCLTIFCCDDPSITEVYCEEVSVFCDVSAATCEVFPSFSISPTTTDCEFLLSNTSVAATGSTLDTTNVLWSIVNTEGAVFEFNTWDVVLPYIIIGDPSEIVLTVNGTSGNDSCSASYAVTDPEINCDLCPEDLDGDGSISTGDLLNLLSVFGTTCQ